MLTVHREPPKPAAKSKHDFVRKECIVCAGCGNCTGYGSGCCRHKDLRPRGQPCGCGIGESGCSVCKMCKACASKLPWFVRCVFFSAATLPARLSSPFLRLLSVPNNPACTYNLHGPAYVTQSWFECTTCSLNDGKGVCEPCAKSCHAGHTLVPHASTACQLTCSFPLS
jgi:Putative zinc finger in N-recognin (UBR box)